MTFTTENQRDNKITNTTTQTVKHVIYSDNSVNITGMNGLHTVWLTQGRRVSQKADGLNLVDSVKFANELIKSI